jgi:nucleoside-diphosphate-sugar epimerase
MEKVLVIGKNSFIGKHLKKYDRISYYDIDLVDFSEYTVVINCALNPLYKTNTYAECIDVDLKIGRLACGAGCHFIMMSTSKVYGSNLELKFYNEFDTTLPDDNYGKNKLITEVKLLSNYPNKLTVLRGSNIFGFEYGRNSFMGYCMSQLVNEGVIKLTMSPDVKRDFLFVEDAARIIENVCMVKPKGVYNLSSGTGMSVGDFIQSTIDGYGYDAKIKYLDEKPDRQFILDNTKLTSALNMISIGPFDYNKVLYELGKKLCEI